MPGKVGLGKTGKSTAVAKVTTKEEATMQSQTTFTRAKTLGPFLTLILLSSPRRDRAGSEILRPASAEGSTPDYTPLARAGRSIPRDRAGSAAAETGTDLDADLDGSKQPVEALMELAVRRL